jgi:hypothetical protein
MGSHGAGGGVISAWELDRSVLPLHWHSSGRTLRSRTSRRALPPRVEPGTRTHRCCAQTPNTFWHARNLARVTWHVCSTGGNNLDREPFVPAATGMDLGW